MRIIVGLGNPGEQYDATRHNLGFMAVDALAEKLGLSWRFNKKFNALVAKGAEVILLKPQTFMNDSGRAVAAALDYFKAQTADLIVIHDDLDIELGKFKNALGSRSAGHRGVQSIIDRLKTKDFKRLRLGLKTPAAEKIPAEKYVLQKFKAAELKTVKTLLSIILNELK